MSTLRLYYDDAHRREFTAQVLTCQPTVDGWHVVLDRTAFYPTSGGQPHDTGELAGRQVLEVTADDDSGVVIHRLDGPVSGSVTGRIDWERRQDHMEQHTGQHLLSQAFVQVLAAPTVSFHMGARTSTIDLARDDANADDIARVEDLANAVVRSDRPVRVQYAASAAELARFPLRKPPAMTGRVRVVEIADFDWSACGGSHVARTGEIGLIRIKSWERYKKGLRVTFLCGGRAASDYRSVDSMVRDLCLKLSFPPEELPRAVLRFRDEAQQARRIAKQAQDRLVEMEAQSLLEAVRPVLGGLRVVRMTFSGRPVDEVRQLATKVVADGKAVALFGIRSALPQLIFARSPDVRLDMAAILQVALPAIGGRGGGGPALAQGGGTRPEGLATALDMAYGQVNRVQGGKV